MKKILIAALALFSSTALMSNDITWSFPPATLSSSGLNGSDPQIATDANGNLASAWVENGLVKARTKLVSSMTWSSPVTLSNSGASSPRIVSDINGNLSAVWLESGVVKGATKTFLGSWSSATTLSFSGATSPALAVDAAGDVIAAWARSGNIEASTKPFGGTWHLALVVLSDGAAFPQVAIGGSGSSTTAVIVWQGTVSGTSVVYTSFKQPITGLWSSQQAISNTAYNSAYADVAVDGNGNAVAVWYQYNVQGSIYSNVVVQSSYRNVSSGSWNSVANLSLPGIENPANLVACVGFDGSGNAIAVWNTSFDGETFNIESAVLPVRSSWSAPTDLVALNDYSFDVDLAVNSFGDALSVYMFYNGASLIIQSAETDLSGFMNNLWSVPTNISTGNNNGFPRVASTVTGNAINAAAVWISSNGTYNSVQAVSGTRTIVLPPTGPSVTQSANHFGVFTEYYNTVSWTASTDPNVVGYLVFRNGVLIEQVYASELSIVDHNRVESGSVTYGVAAIDNQQSQSRIINVSYP